MAFTLPPNDSKADYVKNKFTGIARKYDLFNDLVTQGMHRFWKRFLVKKTGLQLGDRVVDICCGTGDITQLLQKRVGDLGTVIGLDFSPGMLAVAAERNLSKTVVLLQGDAMVLPLKDNSIDAVTVGYGLRNLVDIEACLREVNRILKPGGRFLSLDMGKVKYPLIKQLFDFYFFKVVPRIGKLIYPGEDMFDYFPQSSVDYPSQEKLAEMMRALDFSEVRFFNFYFGGVVVHQAEKG